MPCQRPRLVLAISALVLAVPSIARADRSSEARADALFAQGKRLRAAGRYPEACSKFAECQSLSPGAGVALSLADCYEHLGQTASAWQEYRTAEQLARGRDDGKRAAAAHDRALVLEPTLPRLTIEVPPTAASHGVEVQFDGIAISRDAWNVALVVDPGDHVVQFKAPGKAVRTAYAHLDAATPAVTVDAAELAETAPPTTAAAATPASTLAMTSAQASTRVTTPATTAPPPMAAIVPRDVATGGTAPQGQTPAPRSDRVAGPLTNGLVGVGFLGVGLGAALLAVDSKAPATGTGPTTPRPDAGLTTGAIIAFSAGGAAFVSAFIMQVATSRRARPATPGASLVVAPVPLIGGAGASLGATF